MTTPEASDTFIIDPAASRLTVQAFAGGLLSALGHNPTFATRQYHGAVTFDPATPASASLTLTVKAASLALVDAVSQADRRSIESTMHDAVLESASYPDIRYVSRQATVRTSSHGSFEATLRGTLSLHGVDKPVDIPVKVALTADMLRSVGEFTLRQSDYGIRPVTVAGSMLRVKDDLTCAFDMVARRQPGATAT
ncbi:MAG: YceI family protein [Cytophagaceae bacterium]|nr:YceI family protein [Gemmatimonadaceae bacterium]